MEQLKKLYYNFLRSLKKIEFGWKLEQITNERLNFIEIEDLKKFVILNLERFRV